MAKKYLGEEIDIHAGGEDLCSLIMKMRSPRANAATESPLPGTGSTMRS